MPGIGLKDKTTVPIDNRALLRRQIARLIGLQLINGT